MHKPPRRFAWHIGFALSLAGALLAAGCSRSGTDGEFSYQEIESGQSVAEPPDPAILNQSEPPDGGDPIAGGEEDAPPELLRAQPDPAESVASAEPSATGQAEPVASAAEAIAEGASASESDNPAALRESARSPEQEAIIAQFNGGGDQRGTTSRPAESGAAKPSAGADPKAIEPEARKEPREIRLLVPEKTFKVEGPEGAVRVNYSDIDLLEVLNMDPVVANAVDHFPSWLTELDGRRVRLRGFMFPTYQEEGIKGFVLARDNDICCFVRKPKVYDVVTVKLREGMTTRYIANRPFDVVGVFRISPFSFSGDELDYLYAIEDATIINK